MPEYRYVVPPATTVAIVSAAKPKLLASVLGDETSAAGLADLRLDLTGGRAAAAERQARGRYKGISWRSSVDGKTATCRFTSTAAREYLALHIALLPSLRRLLVEREVALIGAAAFDSNGEATVLAGPTGSGKTALLLGALEQGATFVADEYLGLAATGSVTPVVRALALRGRTLALAPTLAARLSRNQHNALRLASVVRRLTLGRLDPLVHVPCAEVGEHAAAGAPLPVRRVVWLEPGVRGAPRLEPAAGPEIAGHLAMMQAMHDRAYGDLGALFDTARGHADLYPSRWRSVLERGLQDVTCERLTYPSLTREALGLVLP